jgi:hypothetical protein
VWVYKSGTVVVIGNSSDNGKMIAFDATGEQLFTQSLSANVCESDKCYGFDRREFVVVAFEHGYLSVFEVCTFDLIAKTPITEAKRFFCCMKNTVSILTMDGTWLVRMSFENAIQTIVLSANH